MNGPRLALLPLPPEEAGADRLLGRFEHLHPGVSIVRPHHADEPWRVAIDGKAIPGDDREMILTSYRPSELLAKLEAAFAGDDPEDSG